jgi:hypothetical protein
VGRKRRVKTDSRQFKRQDIASPRKKVRQNVTIFQKGVSARRACATSSAVAFVKPLFYNNATSLLTRFRLTVAEKRVRHDKSAETKLLNCNLDWISAPLRKSRIPAFWLDRRAAVRVLPCDINLNFRKHCRANIRRTGEGAGRAAAGSCVPLTACGLRNTQSSRVLQDRALYTKPRRGEVNRE